jgi:hypothetical protein
VFNFPPNSEGQKQTRTQPAFTRGGVDKICLDFEGFRGERCEGADYGVDRVDGGCDGGDGGHL